MTFSLPPTAPPTTTNYYFHFFIIRSPASRRPSAEPTQPLSLPPQSLGGTCGGAPSVPTVLSRLDRHVTYYPHICCTYVDTLYSLPSLKYTVVARLLTCLHLSTLTVFPYTVKKVSDFPVPSQDVTNQTLPCRELFPGQGEFGYSAIPAGDGKSANIFLQCIIFLPLPLPASPPPPVPPPETEKQTISSGFQLSSST